MTNELKIEHYLRRLDRELRVLPVSEKAEIITEIKSHIAGALAKDSAWPLTAILAQLGSPRAVAAQYLANKGLKPRGGSRRILKWLAGGTIAVFVMIFMTLGLGVYLFTRLIDFDTRSGRISVYQGHLGGTDASFFKVGGLEVSDRHIEGVTIKGQDDLTGQHVNLIKIPFNTAKLELRPAAGNLFTWDCRAAEDTPLKPVLSQGVLTLNLDGLNLAKCSIGLPTGVACEFHGINGHMEINGPRDNLNVTLTNGKVNIHPDPTRAYDFDVKVKNGLQDFFAHSAAKDAVKVTVNVVNGLVNKQ